MSQEGTREREKDKKDRGKRGKVEREEGKDIK